MKKLNNIKHNRLAHDNIANVYNLKHNEIYNNIEQNRLEYLVLTLVRRAGVERPNVLDFGAGTGNLAKKFIKNGCLVTACDVSSESLLLLQKDINSENLKVALSHDKLLQFTDNYFDIVATYSVLHHVNDYLAIIEEMIRVTKKGGLIYIDHEANKNRWRPDSILKEYYGLTRQTKTEHFIKLFKTRELFTLDFIKTVLISFFNKKYQREGDIHVWPDDCIEWEKIKNIIIKNNCEIIMEKDYLMYKPKGSMELFNNFKNRCNDTKYLIFKK